MPARLASVALTGIVVITSAVFAADIPSLRLVIQNQQFSPQEFNVPPNTKVEILVSNHDNKPAEFESYDLSREVVVPGHSSVTIYSALSLRVVTTSSMISITRPKAGQ